LSGSCPRIPLKQPFASLPRVVQARKKISQRSLAGLRTKLRDAAEEGQVVEYSVTDAVKVDDTLVIVEGAWVAAWRYLNSGTRGLKCKVRSRVTFVTHRDGDA
jgi:hypothetical protein